MPELDNRKAVRIWKQINVDEVKKQLIYIEDLYGMCANCKKLGLNYLKDAKCPQCGAVFKYASTKLTKKSDIMGIISRIKSKGLPLELIEREDFNKASAKNAIGDLFK